jgi:hypothetical protein
MLRRHARIALISAGLMLGCFAAVFAPLKSASAGFGGCARAAFCNRGCPSACSNNFSVGFPECLGCNPKTGRCYVPAGPCLTD